MLEKVRVLDNVKDINQISPNNKLLKNIEHHESIININPLNTESWLKLANLYRKQDRIDEVANCFRQLIKLQPQKTDFYRSLAQILRNQKNTDELIAICSQVIAIDSKQPRWVYRELIGVQNKDSLMEKAINTYQEAIQNSSQQPAWVYFSLGHSFLEKDLIEEAIEAYQKGLKIYPNNPHFYLSLGNAYVDLSDFETAINFYQKAINIAISVNNADDTTIPQAYIKLGNIYLKQNQIEKAINTYKKAISIKPIFRGYMNLGNLYQDLNSYELAVDAYHQAKLLDPENPRVYLKLGNAYQQMQQWEEAIFSYQKALPLSINRFVEITAYREIKNIYLQQKNSKAAIDIYKQEITNYALINQKYKIIYLPLAKNACTLFITMMIKNSSEWQRYQDFGDNIYAYSRRHDTQFGVPDFSYFSKNDYFKFTILRNPFNRLVSAYLDKIVKYNELEPFAQQVIRDIQNFLNINYNPAQSITFRQFILYLSETEDYLLNEHWRSQHTFLGREILELDYLGQFEELDSVIKFLENKFDFTITTDVEDSNEFEEHITKYVEYDSNQKVCDTYPTELKFLKILHGGFPKATSFYTPDLIELVTNRFAKDISIYQQQFGVSLENMIPD